MKNKFFYLLTIMLLVVSSVSGQNFPTQHFKVIPQLTAADTALIMDSIYANGNHDSLISIDYKLYRNGVLIDTVSKYGWAELRLRQMGEEYVSGRFDSGTFVFPEAIPFAGMVAHSFTISVINAEPKCNRNRVPIIRLNFREPGTYKLVAEIYSQIGYKADYIGTLACSKYKDAYSLVGSKRMLWTKDSVSYVVKPTYVVSDTASVCEGGIYFWRGMNYTVSGLYKDVRHNADGSDSVYQLKLTVYPSAHNEKVILACQGVPQYWRGKYYTVAGIYYDSVTNKYGCKDYYKLELKVRPHFLHSDTAWVCKGESYRWRGRTITSTGRFTQVYTPVYHCDSVYELWVYNHPTYHFRDTAVICSGGSYAWRGRTLLKAGTYVDSLKTIYGCDSLYCLTLKIDNGFFRKDAVDVCSIDGTYAWHGRNLTVSGFYTDSLKNRHGCDSVYHLDFRIRPAYLFTEFDTVNSNKDYIWAGRNRNLGKPSRGNHVFWDSLKTSAGCDSVYKLTLTVFPTFFHAESASVCENAIYQWSGHAVNIGRKAAGNYVFWDSLKSIYGSDSVYKLTLTVHPEYAFNESATTCANEAYVWKGHAVNIGVKKAGSHVVWDSLKTVNGCDSVYRLNLKVYPAYYVEQQVAICSSDIYTWPGHEVGIGKRDVGTYVFWDSLRSVNGCDSVFKLMLTVNPAYNFTESTEVCANETYVWQGHDVNIGRKGPGTYTFWDRRKTVRGCDSTYRLTLAVRPSYYFESADSTCDAASYVWKGHTVDFRMLPAGTHVVWDSLKSVNGCDSVYKLTLTVFPHYLSNENTEVCEGQVLNWRGRRLSSEGVYDDTLKTVNGCDSIIRMRFTVHSRYQIQEIVPICHNSSYNWRGRRLTEAGVYVDSLKSMYGCDSIYRLELRVKPVYLFEDTIEGCDGHSYAWRGRQLHQPGRYVDSLKASFGCDSVFVLILRMHPVYERADTVEICGNVSYAWHGGVYSKSGVYADTLQSIWGCDSICRLRLTVHPVYVMRDTQEICQNERMAWRGKRYAQAGLYGDSLHTVHGCDSIYTLCLIVRPVFEQTDTVVICSHETYQWRGRTLHTAGHYDEQLVSRYGCDSIYNLLLMVNPSYYIRDTQEICDGATYYWRGRRLSKAGTYTDSLTSADGCPLIYTLSLKVNATYRQADTAVICDNETYAWQGMELRQSGEYETKLRTVHGCDSVLTLKLQVHPTYRQVQQASVCARKEYVWRGRRLTQAGEYRDSLQSQAGCDSILVLQLSVFPVYMQYDTVRVCQGSAYVWHGRGLVQTGDYVDSMHTAEGCDSIAFLHLQVDSVYHFSESRYVCEGTVLPWRGRYLPKAGIYYDSLKTVRGCDSLYRMELHTYPVYYQEDTVSICEGESYVWRGQNLSVAGRYYDRMQSIYGCDSTYVLYLTVHPQYLTNEYAAICDGESYAWHGKLLSEQKRYIDTLQSVYGCDSVTRIFLYVYPHYHFKDTVNYCGKGIYTWRNRNFDRDGCYTDSFKTVNGCDSIYTLYLRFRSIFYQEEQKEICEGETYAWRGRELAQAGVYYDSLQSIYGCDSVYCLNLDVHPVYQSGDTQAICPGDTLRWQGMELVQAGTYADTLQTLYGCDSIRVLFLTVRELPEKLGRIYGDTLIAKDGVYMYFTDTLDGIDSYEWKVVPEDIELTASGWKAWLTLDKTAYGMDTLMVVGHHVCGTTEASVLPVHVTIGVRVLEAEMSGICRAYPNPVQGEVFVEVPSVHEWYRPSWMLCDAQGRCLSTGSLEDIRTRISLEDYARGMYLLRLFSGHKAKATLKIVKY